MAIFGYFENIKIAVSLGDTLTYILKHPRLQVPFDKFLLICTANLYFSLVSPI